MANTCAKPTDVSLCLDHPADAPDADRILKLFRGFVAPQSSVGESWTCLNVNFIICICQEHVRKNFNLKQAKKATFYQQLLNADNQQKQVL